MLVCVCIRYGAVDFVTELRCWETSGEPVEWSVRVRGIWGKNTNKHCYSLNRAILLQLLYYMPVHISSTMCSSSGQNCIIQHLVSSHL